MMSARTNDKCMRRLQVRVALVLSWALCAVQCAIEPPPGVYVCAHGERCPVRQYCHVSDGLCHAVPEVPDSLHLDPDDSGTGAEADAYVDANTGPDPDAGGGGGPALECAEGAFECVATRYRVCNAAGRWSAPELTVMECGIVCLPGERRCLGKTQEACDAAGKVW
ncbi:MAG: hypothetical protein RL701_6685, partial [Pseudomonadota bacterium]